MLLNIVCACESLLYWGEPEITTDEIKSGRQEVSSRAAPLEDPSWPSGIALSRPRSGIFMWTMPPLGAENPNIDVLAALGGGLVPNRPSFCQRTGRQEGSQ